MSDETKIGTFIIIGIVAVFAGVCSLIYVNATYGSRAGNEARKQCIAARGLWQPTPYGAGNFTYTCLFNR